VRFRALLIEGYAEVLFYGEASDWIGEDWT
jgi:hypothetical protein